MKNLMTMFWQKHLNAILENHSGFQPPPWLVNFALDFWPPLMVIADVIGVLWGKPIFKDKIFSLAEKIITSRKMDDSSITLEEKILQAVQGFIKATKPMDDDTRFYNGLFMLQYIRDMLDMPRLTPEKISEVLNRSGIVLERWRPRIEIDDEKRSTKKINVKKIIQVTCYHLNEEKLSELLCRNYPQEDRNGPPSN